MNQTSPVTTPLIVDPAPRTLTLAERFLAMLDTEESAIVAARLRPVLERLSMGLFRVVVMGEIKKGKSSFINALIGEHGLLPTATDIATSTVYKLIYGPERAFSVFFQPDRESPPEVEPPTLDITAERLAEFGTEDGNPGNAKRVEFIGVELPNPMLKDGLIIVDTPGVGGLFRQHRDISFRYAPNADVVIFVLDSVEAVISADEIRFLRDLQKIGAPLVFVQTKTDAAGTEQWQVWQQRNLDILAEQLGMQRERIAYFPVSAKLKRFADENKLLAYLTRSGFTPLLHHLKEEILRNKTAMLVRQAATLLANEAAARWEQLAESRRIHQEQNRGRLEELENKLAEARQKAAEWEGDAMRRQRQGVVRKLEDAQRVARNALHDALEPQNGTYATMFCQRAEAQFTDLETLNARSSEYLGDCAVETIQWVHRTLSDYRDALLSGCAVGVAEMEQSLNDTIGERTITLGPISTCAPAPVMGDVYDKLSNIARGAFQGGNVGGMVTTVAGMGFYALGMLTNPVGWVLTGTALAATLFGALKGYRAGEELQNKAAMDKLKQAIREFLQRANREAMRSLDELGVQSRRAFEDAVVNLTHNTRQQLQTREVEVRAARKSTAEQNKQQENAVAEQMRKLECLKVEIAALLAA